MHELISPVSITTIEGMQQLHAISEVVYACLFDRFLAEGNLA